MLNHSEKNRFQLKQIEDLVKQDSISALNESHYKTLLNILKDERDHIRIRAFKILAKTRDERFLAPLIGDFIVNSWQYQLTKGDCLIKFGPVVIRPLMLNYDRMPFNAKRVAISVLGSMKDPVALDFFRSVITYENKTPTQQDYENREISKSGYGDKMHRKN